MRFATLATPAGPRASVQAGEFYIDLQATDPSLPSNVKTILEAQGSLDSKIEAAKSNPKAVKVAVSEAKLHAPVIDPQKIICVGLNYRDHAIECNLPIPRDPVLFNKFNNTLIGHGENIIHPKVSVKVDYEAELVLVIGKTGRYIPESQAQSYVAGYAVGHDVSARDWQMEKDGKQWMAGKTFDTFAPIGPVLVTADEVKDPHHLNISLRLNGKTMQNSNTKQFIFNIPQMVSYISQIVTLMPGDIIFTGTPPGIGNALTPQVFLKPGDVTEVEIEGLGVLKNTVVGE
ncbi:fumarylacetoacetate hydrolase family protein [Telmatocola sphagniphila]|uniref:Fumarylacetoacetate hydrolase family protein n=1 Tax=Telmatocola sphagniphila TaxID=1123043 RepID=A0A8E6BBS0_9BACT|nr:fumarylacetoacetate hydrolase family protein [Telmatocola sphagniphila]QVL34248.1 fumarylacetoacetate hydrolase family protein [Telmatocola sphagniphila]